MTFQIGDKVARRGAFPNERVKRGTVEEVYRSRPNGVGETVAQYAVLWEDGYIERGYMDIGLELEQERKS